MTSAHRRDDVRIYQKQIKSLIKSGYHVTYIVADGLCCEKSEMLNIIDVGNPKNRYSRFFKNRKKILQVALGINVESYHFHDPDLLSISKKLKQTGRVVIYDAHENLKLDILSKPYIPRGLRRAVSLFIGLYEKYIISYVDIVFAANDNIGSNLNGNKDNACTIHNYPLLYSDLYRHIEVGANNEKYVVFVGGMTPIRGIREIIASLAYMKNKSLRIKLLGVFSSSEYRAECLGNNKNRLIDEEGFCSREVTHKVTLGAVAGLVLYLPEPSHIEASPNKMFEYMEAGIPVIASDFPLWKKIIEGGNCGICVDPFDSKAIAGAIDFLVDNPNQAKRMGENGKRLVAEEYNWCQVENILLNKYDELLN